MINSPTTVDRPDTVTVGLVQFEASQDKTSNIHKALQLAAQAATHGAQIITFPEMFLMPWVFATQEDHKALAETADSPVWETFRALAFRHQVVLVCPFYEQSEQGDAGRYYNATLVIDANGATAGRYRKHHLPPDNERWHFALGDGPIRGIDTQFGRIGVYICWENFIPEGARLLGLDGVHTVFAPSAATSTEDAYRWEVAVRANAMVNSCYWVRTNRIEPPFYGKSFIVNPAGEYAVLPLDTQERVTITTLDLTLIDRERSAWTYLADRRPDQYDGLR
jgi:predicted amidohydrolase